MSESLGAHGSGFNLFRTRNDMLHVLMSEGNPQDTQADLKGARRVNLAIQCLSGSAICTFTN